MQNRSKLSLNPSDLSFPTFINKEDPSILEPSVDELLKAPSKTANGHLSQGRGFAELK